MNGNESMPDPCDPEFGDFVANLSDTMEAMIGQMMEMFSSMGNETMNKTEMEVINFDLLFE